MSRSSAYTFYKSNGDVKKYKRATCKLARHAFYSAQEATIKANAEGIFGLVWTQYHGEDGSVVDTTQVHLLSDEAVDTYFELYRNEFPDVEYMGIVRGRIGRGELKWTQLPSKLPPQLECLRKEKNRAN